MTRFFPFELKFYFRYMFYKILVFVCVFYYFINIIIFLKCRFSKERQDIGYKRTNICSKILLTKQNMRSILIMSSVASCCYGRGITFGTDLIDILLQKIGGVSDGRNTKQLLCQ